MRGSRVPKIAGIIQLVICAFLVVQYLEDREHLQVWSMLLFGLLCLTAGSGILSDGEIALGASVLGFGVALAGGAPMFRTWDRDGHISVAPVEGRDEKGLVFPYSRSKTVAATLAAAGMAVACGGISLGAFQEHEGPTPMWLVAFGIGGFIFFGWIALVSLRRNGVRTGFIALTTSGMAAKLPAMQCFVPWDAIEEVRALEMSVHTGVRPLTSRS